MQSADGTSFCLRHRMALSYNDGVFSFNPFNIVKSTVTVTGSYLSIIELLQITLNGHLTNRQRTEAFDLNLHD